MKKNAPYMLNIDMSLSEDMHICTCKYATSVHNEIVLASMLAGAVVSIAHGHSHNPHKFAETVCGVIMEFKDKPRFTKPKEQLS